MFLFVTFKRYSNYACIFWNFINFFQYPPFLGAFTKLRVSTIIFVMSVRSSVLVVSLFACNTWLPTEQIFMEFVNRGFSKVYREYSSLIKTWQEWRVLTLPEDQNTFGTKSRWILRTMKNILDRLVEKLKTHYYVQYFFPKIVPFVR
jgi:hypothetical protein